MRTLHAKIDVDRLESTGVRAADRPQGASVAPRFAPDEALPPVPPGRGARHAKPRDTLCTEAVYSTARWRPDALRAFENDWLAPVNELAGALERACSSAYGYPVGFFADHESTLMEFLHHYRKACRILRLRALYYHQKGDLENAARCVRLQGSVSRNFDPQTMLGHVCFQSCIQVLYSTTAELCFMRSNDAAFVAALQEVVAAPAECDERVARALSGELVHIRYGAIKKGMQGELLEGTEESLRHIMTLLSERGMNEATPAIRSYATSRMEQCQQSWSWAMRLEGWRGIPTLILMSWKLRPIHASNLLEALLLPPLARAVEKAHALSATQRIAVLCCALKQYKLKRGTFPEKLDALADAGVSPDVLQLPEGYRYRAEGRRFVIYSLSNSHLSLAEVLGIMQTGRGDLHRFGHGRRDFYVIGE